MEVSKAELEKIAHLARIELTENEKESMLQDFNKMLKFVDKVRELDLENEEPLIYISERVNALREDVPGKEVSQQDALKNAADHDTDYYKVPRVVNSGK
jgi:aspartyl-tRNA(Asn)/glutamyl-tRNA(Gln) amidotransferase subunit C